MIWIDLVFAFITMSLLSYLSLTFVGERTNYKLLISIIILTSFALCSRDLFKLSSSIHILLFLIVLTLCLIFIHRINVLLSFIGSLLTMITATLGSLLIASPLLISIGIKIPTQPNGLEWILLVLSELIVPITILVILKVSKLSLARFIHLKES